MNILQLTSNDPPCLVGELLRERFWPRKKECDYGCYTTFEYSSGVEVLAPEQDDDTGLMWQRARYNGVLCRWLWDGDGMLEFTLPDGSVVYNGDCKKDYTWEWL